MSRQNFGPTPQPMSTEEFDAWEVALIETRDGLREALAELPDDPPPPAPSQPRLRTVQLDPADVAAARQDRHQLLRKVGVRMKLADVRVPTTRRVRV